MSMPVQVITLDPESASVQKLIDQLATQGVMANAYRGIDGRYETPALLPGETIDQNRSLKMYQVKLTNSEIGCYLSHLRAVTTAYNAGVDRLCLLEEDTQVEEEFGDILSAIESLPDEIEFIRLMGLKMHSRKFVMPLGTSHQLTRPVKGLCGTQGYVINRNGMQKVINHGRTIAEPIDKLYDHFWDFDLRCYCVEPHLISEFPSTSTIKKNFTPQQGSFLGNKIQKHWVKLCRSSKRRLYLIQNWTDFRPAIKQKTKAGRTTRIH